MDDWLIVYNLVPCQLPWLQSWQERSEKNRINKLYKTKIKKEKL